MTSSRLPGKVLMPAIDDISMLEFMIQRVRRSRSIDDIIVATTINPADDPIIELCKTLNVKYYRGSENDVLLRVLEAHKSIGSEIIVELTGDCPLIDPNIIDEVIQEYNINNYDYVSNDHIRSYPMGLDVQVFSINVLDEVSKKTQVLEDREHVSLYIYKSGEYRLHPVIAKGDLFWPDLRITLDDKGDYNLIKAIIEYFYPFKGFDFSGLEIVKYLKKNIKLLDLLKDVKVSINPYEKTAKRKLSND